MIPIFFLSLVDLLTHLCIFGGFLILSVYFFFSQGPVQRVKLNGDNRTDFIPAAFIGVPNSIAIDWLSRNIYWGNVDTGKKWPIRPLIKIYMYRYIKKR